MIVWDREKKEYAIEKEYGKDLLSFLYQTIIGRVVLKCVFANHWFSALYGMLQKRPASKNKIKDFVHTYDIDMNQYKSIDEYESFDDFFLRKRDVTKAISQKAFDEDSLIAISDAKLKVVKLDDGGIFRVKQSDYDISEFILDDGLSDEFRDGICLIYRLTVDDYHRYVFLDEGYIEREYFIRGQLHTVQSISDRYRVFIRNSRNVSILNTKNFGKVVQVEVGAMLVGKIKNHDKTNFARLEEKGYFEYGGSTIVQIFKKDIIKIDDDIIKASISDIESKVQIGMIIGHKNSLAIK